MSFNSSEDQILERSLRCQQADVSDGVEEEVERKVVSGRGVPDAHLVPGVTASPTT